MCARCRRTSCGSALRGLGATRRADQAATDSDQRKRRVLVPGQVSPRSLLLSASRTAGVRRCRWGSPACFAGVPGARALPRPHPVCAATVASERRRGSRGPGHRPHWAASHGARRPQTPADPGATCSAERSHRDGPGLRSQTGLAVHPLGGLVGACSVCLPHPGPSSPPPPRAPAAPSASTPSLRSPRVAKRSPSHAGSIVPLLSLCSPSSLCSGMLTWAP